MKSEEIKSTDIYESVGEQKQNAINSGYCPECLVNQGKHYELIMNECLVCGWYIGIDDHTDEYGYDYHDHTC